MAPIKVSNIFNRLTRDKYKKPVPPIPPEVWQKPLYFIAFGLGSGALPFAPGTWGTLMAIPFYLLLQALPVFAYCIFVLVFILLSAWIADKVSHEIHIHDHPGMCIDEFAGFFVTMIHAPGGFFWILSGFILFRLFDIWKPWPIDIVDKKITGGFGMILDDVLAGIYSLIIIQIMANILN